MKSINFGKMFKKLETSHILAGVALIVLVWALMKYSNNKSTLGFKSNSLNSTSLVNENESTVMDSNVPTSSNETTVSANDLLPKGASEDAPSGELNGMNFLKAGHHVGINTVSSSLRNANYQLRADPSIPKASVGPWNGSTIESDLERKPLDQ